MLSQTEAAGTAENDGTGLPDIDGAQLDLAGTGANTLFGYMYRDGGNYKKFKDVVLGGRLSKAHVRRIHDALYDHCLFIASDVGLQNLQPLFNNGWEIEVDHPWHEIREIRYVDDAPTSDAGQLPMTVAELMARWPMAASDWNNITVEERLIDAMGLSKGSKEFLKKSGRFR
jgi:hypothetical protein